MLRHASKTIGLRLASISPASTSVAATRLSALLTDTTLAPTTPHASSFVPSHPIATTSALWQQPKLKPQEDDLPEPEVAPPKPNLSDNPTAPVLPHPGMETVLAHAAPAKDTYWLMQPVYTKDYVLSIKPTHTPPTKFHEYTGYYAVQTLRSAFDLFTGYGKQMDEKKWLRRFIYLETVAGVPGMVGAMIRHLRSLRTMKRDNGWIHTLLEEAENERMHLLTFLQLREPGPVFRAAVLGGQAVVLTLYSFFYAVSPRHCHAFVGYLEEEAVKTYTRAIDDLDSGRLPTWEGLQAPLVAKKYWKLGEKADMRDLLLAVRADEACHQHVNATLAGLKGSDPNPFAPGTTLVQ